MSEKEHSSEDESALSVYELDKDIRKFREYLRIPSIVSEEYNYESCVEFIKREAVLLDLPVTVLYPGSPNKPFLVIEWEGTMPVLPKVAFSSHMDVTPIFENNWTHPPFSADIDEKGRIYARGAQDMKCSGMQYLAAIRALKEEHIRLMRTILILFVPDSLQDGKLGWQAFLKTNEFKNLKIAVVFDEGGPTPGETFDVFFGQRAVWQMNFKIPGTPGHASLLLKETAGEKVRYLLDKFMDFRAKEIKRLEQDPKLGVGDITSLNLTVLNGGYHNNVVPPEITLCIDCRLAVLVNHIKFEAMIRKWIAEAGKGIELTFIQKDPNIPPTVLEYNPFWNAFRKAMEDLKLKIAVKISGFSSDSRYMRQIGLPAIGFSAINKTEPRTHIQDEYLGADTYLKGIEIWKQIMINAGNAQI